MKTKLAGRILSLILILALVLPCASCARFSGASFAGSYRLSGGDFEQASSSEEFISFGQKDSGSYIESYSLEFAAPSGKDIHIAYRSHIQDAGWYQWSPSGQEITYQQFYGIDTIQVFLYGKDALMYDVSYRVAVAGEDWQEWVSNGAMAGVPDQHRPIEAVEIRLKLHEEYETPSWTITQFGDDDGRQSEFYTMRNNDDGTLIVIDGGWEANTSQVRSVIELLGGHVDHWFLTHYDEDHASAFNAIYADPGDIEIGEVYCTPLDYDYYLECASERYWDVPWVYETFLEQTEGDERIHRLERGDVFTIDGLNIEVFNSYDQLVLDTGSRDVANFGSLMFKITGTEDSFLVCGDVYGSLWLELAELYGERLQATYVQPGHHGNNHVAPESWGVTEAEVMLFDGPAWLTESDDYSARALIEWCHGQGILTYEYQTAPNSFPFN